MLLSLFAAVVCAAIPVADPLEVSAQAAPGEAAVEVGAHLTPTTFRARNFSDVTQVLAFSNGFGSPVLVGLPAGGIASYTFPPEALVGLRLEFVSLRPGAWMTSGYHTLSVPAETGAETLWTQPGETRLHTWLQIGCEISLLPSEGTSLPPGLLDQGSDIESLLAPTHVPVITPSGGSQGNIPPPIEPVPLPPV